MSHYLDLETQMIDEKALVKALGRMGYNNVETHANATNLYGYQGDMRPQKANVIVRRKYISSSANDIGWQKTEEGTFKAHISEFDSHRHNEDWQKKLATYYNVEKAKMAYDKRKIKCVESTDAQNRPTVKAYL